MDLFKRFFRYIVGLGIKIPFIRRFGFNLVEKLPFLRSLIMNMAGSSAVIIENGQFKLSETDHSGYFFGASEITRDKLTKRQSSLFTQLHNRYHHK